MRAPDEIAPRVNRGQTVACCERDNEIAMGDDRGIRDDEEAAVGHSRERFNRALNVGVVVADRTWDEFNRERWRRRRGKSQEVVIPSELWIGDESHARKARCDLLKHREPLPHNATLVL